MARWDDNFTHHRVGGDAVFDQMLTPGRLNGDGPMSYAFGLQVHSYRGLPIVEHSGADAGYRAHYLRFPGERVAIVCLCNLSTMTPRPLALAVADLILPERFSEPLGEAVVKSSEDEARFSGVYRDRATGDLLKVTNDDEGLSLGFDDGQRLERLTDGAYRVDGQPLTRLRFEERDGAMRLVYGALYSPVPDPIFERVDEPERSALRPVEGGAFHSVEVDATYVLEPDGESLLMKHHRLDARTLHHAYGDTYATNNFRIVLERDDAGAVTGFRASTFRVRDVLFKRC
jgi:hypothetical protein